MKCDLCQLESERADIFKHVRRSFRSTNLILCPACVEKRENKINTLLFWSYLICGVLAIPLILYPTTNSIGLLFLIIAVLQLFVLISTILHEFGHALGGKLLNSRVFGIEIGKGQIVYEFRVGGIRWRMRAIPFGGLTSSIPTDPHFFKLKKFLTVLCGPLINAILLFISIEFLSLDDLFKPTVLYGFMPMTLLALSNAILLIYSLWPHMTKTMVGKIPNDGLQMWKVWQMPQKQIDTTLSARYSYEARECCADKKFAEARKWIDAGLKIYPNNTSLKLMSGHVLYWQKEYKSAWRTYALLIGRHKEYKDLDSLLLNGIAYNILLMGKSDLMPKADIASRLALKQKPWIIHFKGTRGSVLIELGNYEEGLKLLHEAMQNHPEKSGKALDACYIGIAEARRGNFVESRNYFSTARKLDPDCVLLERELPPQIKNA